MSDEKTYRFISDPRHKENLSGRVRAACVTCRRKKIKCSGEVPCSTCEERGLVCEGLTDRKRPRRTSERRSRASSRRDERRSSRDSGLDEVGPRSHRSSFDSSSSRAVGGDEHPQRPTAGLQKFDTQESEDSGYASILQSAHESSTTLQLETRLSLNYRFTPSYTPGYDYSADVSPSTIDPESILPGKLEAQSFPAIEPGVSSPSHGAPSIEHSNTAAWTYRRGRFPTWANGASAAQATTKLLSAAQTLEQQAQSLRKLASRSNQESADDTRRQTIAFPIYNESPASLYDSIQSPFGSFDDMSLMIGQRTSGSGLIPLPVDFNSEWDARALLSSSPGFPPGPICNTPAGAAAHNVEGASTEWPDFPNSYDVTTSVAGPRGFSNNTAEIQEQKRTMSQFEMYHGRPEHGYQQLYPWPE